MFFDDTLRTAQADAITTRVGSAGLLRIYDGTPPANESAALSGNTQLAQLTCGSPFAPAASAGVLTPTTPSSDTNADATGTPTFYRVFRSDGTTCVIQGTASGTGGGGEMEFSGLVGGQFVAGGTVAISTWTITIGN